MKDWLHDLIVIVQKELLYIFRVPDVLIFSVLIPMALYPVLMIGAGIYSAWSISNQRTQTYKIATSQSPPAKVQWLTALLKSTKRVAITTYKDPDVPLRAKEVEVALLVDPLDKNIEIHYDEFLSRSNSAVHFITDTVDFDEKKRIKALLEENGLHGAELEPTNVKLRDIKAIKKESAQTAHGGGNFNETYAPLLRFGVLLAIFFLISNARSSAVSPAVFMLAQERDLKTLRATLSLPISWNTLILGKAISVACMSILSVVVNALGVGLLLGFVLISLISNLPSSQSPIQSILQSISFGTVAIITLSALLDILLSSCTLLLLCSMSKTTKEAQSILIISSLAMVGVSIFALAPGATLNVGTALIPMMNLLLVIKAATTGADGALPVFVAIAETLLLIYLAVHLTAYRLAQESFILSGEMQIRCPWQRR
ncbi:MAG: ABC transporter permease subunit [Leptolyngbya sp.]|nr:ABC transporter permease subunit [Candidatus Melainabacteria bacterium]